MKSLAVETPSVSGGIPLDPFSWAEGRSVTASGTVYSHVRHLAVVPATPGPPVGHAVLNSMLPLLVYTPNREKVGEEERKGEREGGRRREGRKGREGEGRILYDTKPILEIVS